MKIRIAVTIAVLSLLGTSAYAQCTNGSLLNQNALSSAFSGNTICGQRAGAAADANNRWQEEHFAGGALWDYKRGDGDSVDPRKPVGTWVITDQGANTRIAYTYQSGSATSGPYSHSVHLVSGVYEFCTGPGTTVVARAFVQPGINVGCSSYPAP